MIFMKRFFLILFLVFLSLKNFAQDAIPIGSEWYYEIVSGGKVSYQYLSCQGDTTVNDEDVKIIIKSNTLYNKEALSTEVEYIYEEDSIVYWYNKKLGDFTVLYDFTAKANDGWRINVLDTAVNMKVDFVNYLDYMGVTRKVIHARDRADNYNGLIVYGIGHLKSFFPEELLDNDYRVNGLRCYWLNGELLYKHGLSDCETFYDLEENEGAEFVIYPNPARDAVFLKLPQNNRNTSDSVSVEIFNMMGVLVRKHENCDGYIDVSDLTAGTYFFKVGNKGEVLIINR